MISYMDESGDHNLDLTRLNNHYNVFVLGAVNFEEKEYQEFDQNFRQLKIDMFGSDDYIIHTAEIIRPNKCKDNRSLLFNDTDFRKTFYSSLEKLIMDTTFSIAACCVKKEQHISRYGGYASDPYMFSFENVLNRILFRAKGSECHIFPEKRSHAEDTLLELNFLKTKVAGTKFFQGVEVSQRVKTFEPLDKKSNESGLQLADLIVSPIGRNVMGISPRPVGNELPYSVVRKKIPANCLTIFP